MGIVSCTKSIRNCRLFINKLTNKRILSQTQKLTPNTDFTLSLIGKSFVHKNIVP